MSIIKFGLSKDGYRIYCGDWIEDMNFCIPFHLPFEEIVAAIPIDINKKGMQTGRVVMDKDVGDVYCVEVDSSDLVYYAKSAQGSYHIKSVVNKAPISTATFQYVVYIGDNSIIVYYLTLGETIPPEPNNWQIHMQENDPIASYEKSEVFWKNHAWIPNMPGSSVIADSITSNCPW